MGIETGLSITTLPKQDFRQVCTLDSLGVPVFHNPTDRLSEELLHQINFLQTDEAFLGCEVVTSKFYPGKADWGDGWVRGGAESFYQVYQVNTLSSTKLGPRYVALKAIHSLGGETQNKVESEARRLSLLNQFGIAPKVYAVGPGTLIKEFLIEDEQKMSKDELNRQLQIIHHYMTLLGISTQFDFRTTILGASIQNQGILKIIDAGSGDMNGPTS